MRTNMLDMAISLPFEFELRRRTLPRGDFRDIRNKSYPRVKMRTNMFGMAISLPFEFELRAGPGMMPDPLVEQQNKTMNGMIHVVLLSNITLLRL
jgi:hypothetical protein